MNEEIKILRPGQILDYVDTMEHLQELFNYITNLQKENEKLKEENRHIFANVNDDELLRSNAMNYAELQECKKRIDKAIEVIDLIKPELWNISNKMTYRLIDVKNILGGDE